MSGRRAVDPRTMQQWIGHRSLATTLKYAHISPTIDRDSASANHGTRMAPAFRAHEKGTRNEASLLRKCLSLKGYDWCAH